MKYRNISYNWAKPDSMQDFNPATPHDEEDILIRSHFQE